MYNSYGTCFGGWSQKSLLSQNTIELPLILACSSVDQVYEQNLKIHQEYLDQAHNTCLVWSLFKFEKQKCSELNIKIEIKDNKQIEGGSGSHKWWKE